YRIDGPVNLPRQKSAMLPVLNERVEARRVSVFNQGTHARHPMLALKLKNTTKLHLMQGPITVFDGDSYAGDARVLDVQPNEERPISYALDQGVEVRARQDPGSSKVVKVAITRGVATTTTEVREQRVYEIKNRSEEPRTVVVEHPYRPDFRLKDESKLAEKTANLYRFQVEVAPGKLEKLDVIEEKPIAHEVALTNADDETIAFLMRGAVASDEVKAALREVVRRKSDLAAAQRELERSERDLKDLFDDQARIRANLERAPKESEAYKRYLKKFD